MALRVTQTKFVVTAVGVFFDAHGRVLVLRHVYRHHHPWGLPAGFIDAGETPEVGILRELKEETSLSAGSVQILSIRSLSRRHLEVAVMGAVDSTQAISLNHEIFEAVFADPLDLPPGLPSSQGDLVRRAMAVADVR
tara:strand:- start:1260 stop:1670 length:411 start_codon:yes stop_codon:yes gene_type:complete